MINFQTMQEESSSLIVLDYTMLEFFAFLLIYLASRLNTYCNLMQSTCMLVQILCFPLSNLEILHHFLVLFEADQTLAMLSSLVSLSNIWPSCLPSTIYSWDLQTRISYCTIYDTYFNGDRICIQCRHVSSHCPSLQII